MPPAQPASATCNRPPITAATTTTGVTTHGKTPPAMIDWDCSRMKVFSFLDTTRLGKPFDVWFGSQKQGGLSVNSRMYCESGYKWFFAQYIPARQDRPGKVHGFYVYLHPDPALREAQLNQRQERTSFEVPVKEGERQGPEIGDPVIILVLLTLLHHPGAKAADVVRYLRGHSPPITMTEVCIVFTLYELDGIGKKGRFELLNELRWHAHRAGWSAAEITRATAEARRGSSLHRICRTSRRMPGLRQPGIHPKVKDARFSHSSQGCLMPRKYARDVHRMLPIRLCARMNSLVWSSPISVTLMI